MRNRLALLGVILLSITTLNLAVLSIVLWRRNVEREQYIAQLEAQLRQPPPEASIGAQAPLSNVEQINLAVGAGNAARLATLLDAHPELVNANTHNRFGSTPLHFAAYNKQPEIAAELIKRGANVNATNNDGRTPLHDAITVGSAPVARILLDHGADVTLRSKTGKDALELALEKKRNAIVEMIQSRNPVAR